LEEWVEFFRVILRSKVPHTDSSETERMRWVDQAHPKRELRRAWDKDRREAGLMEDNRSGTERGIDYKCKPGETLAKGKNLRAIGDLGVDAAAVAGYMMDWVKEAFEVKFVYKECMAVFVKKPSKDALVQVFMGLMCPEFKLVMYYFSDDSCVAIRCTDGLFKCNMDVSACDGSNYNSVFDTLQRAMTVDAVYNKDVERVFAQLTERCIIRSTQSRAKVVLFPLFKTLYSGSVLTTCVNNMAEIFMFISMADRFVPMTISEAPAFIESSAANAGYLVKVQPCEFPEDLQFLKHSPMMGVDGVWHPVLNAGVLLRNFGRSWGDLPGSSKVSIMERAKAYNSDVVKSYVHAGNTSLVRAFRDRFIVDASHQGHKSVKYLEAVGQLTDCKRLDMGDVEITDESFCQRYRLGVHQIGAFNETILTLGEEMIVCSDVVDAILGADYGYEPTCS